MLHFYSRDYFVCKYREVPYMMDLDVYKKYRWRFIYAYVYKDAYWCLKMHVDVHTYHIYVHMCIYSCIYIYTYTHI